MTFVHLQFDESSRSFRLLENDLDGMFADGGIYLIAVTRPDSDSDAEWLSQTGEIAHA
jgi:hypothetical protein